MNTKLYPLHDMYFKHTELYDVGLSDQKYLRAKRTGEFRAPKKDEWFLSGAIAEAYRSFYDLPENCKYWIVKIVRVESKTIEKIVLEY